MGKTWSKLKYSQNISHQYEEFIIIASASDWCLKFDVSKSYGMCVGIDADLSNGGTHSSEFSDDIAAKSAKLIRRTIAGKFIPCDQIHHYTLKMSELCTKEALRVLVLDNASKVQDGGIFLFQFSGYAFFDNNEWALSPAKCVGDANSGITADELMGWIASADCKARYILIVLDCCCSRQIGEKLILQAQTKEFARRRDQVHVMCSCCTTDVLPPLKIIDSSLFAYFLSYCLEHKSSDCFDIKNIMDQVAKLCHSFSSLMMSYTQDGGLKPVEVQSPTMYSTLDNKFYKSPTIGDEIDFGANFKPLLDLYDTTEQPLLHSSVVIWLNSSAVQKSLKTLHCNTCLPMSLLSGVFCVMLHSITCLHLKHDYNHLTKRNLFVVAAIEVVSVMQKSGHPMITLTKEQIKVGLEYYYKPMWSLRITAEPIEKMIFDLTTL